jgi:hypothetical protein
MPAWRLRRIAHRLGNEGDRGSTAPLWLRRCSRPCCTGAGGESVWSRTKARRHKGCGRPGRVCALIGRAVVWRGAPLWLGGFVRDQRLSVRTVFMGPGLRRGDSGWGTARGPSPPECRSETGGNVSDLYRTALYPNQRPNSPRSRSTSPAQLWPGAPVTPPPGCVPAPHI